MGSQLQPNASGGSVILVFSLLTLVATITNLCRFWARRLIHLAVGLDDLLSALLLFLAYGLLVITVLAVVVGDLGRGPGIVSDADGPPTTSDIFRCLYAFCFLYGAASILAKLCVLAFYHRVFPTAFMRRCCLLLGVVSIVYGGILLSFNGILLHPRFSSTQKLQDRAIDISLFNAIMSVPNALIDVLLLCLPVRELVRLQTTLAKKTAILGVFMMGGVSVVASIARINANMNWYKDGPTQSLVGPWAAALFEVGFAAIAACLPTLPPVWHRLRRSRLRSATSTEAAATPYASTSRRWTPAGGPGCRAPCSSVLTIGRISANLGGEHWKKRAGNGLFAGIELPGTEFCRVESHETMASLRMSAENQRQQQEDYDESLDAHSKETGVQISARDIDLERI